MPQPSRVRSFLLSDPPSTRSHDVSQQEWYLDPSRIGARPANRVAPRHPHPHPPGPSVYSAPPSRSVSIDAPSLAGGWIDAIDTANAIVKCNSLESIDDHPAQQPLTSRSSSLHSPPAPVPTSTAPRRYLVQCASDTDGFDMETVDSCFLPSNPQRQPPTHQPLRPPLMPPITQTRTSQLSTPPPKTAVVAPKENAPPPRSSAPLLVPGCILELQSKIADTEKRNKKIEGDAVVLQTRTELEKLKTATIQSRVDGLRAASMTPPRGDGFPVQGVPVDTSRPADTSRRERLEALRAAELKYKRLNATLHNALSSPHWTLGREGSAQL